MRETPSETQFHGFLGSLENSDRNAHWARGLDFMLRFPFFDFHYSREAECSVSSSLHRNRVMEARFDVYMIKLLIVVRAFDGVMFSREAWVARSMLNTRACCLRYHIAKGTLGGGGPSA